MEGAWAGYTLQMIERSTGEMIPAYVFIATLPYSQFAMLRHF